jgi:hypothetical protein
MININNLKSIWKKYSGYLLLSSNCPHASYKLPSANSRPAMSKLYLLRKNPVIFNKIISETTGRGANHLEFARFEKTETLL